MAATPSTAGVEALHRLKLTEPPMYLTPSPELSNAARIASEHLFASLKPYTPKSPFDRLLIDNKFDAEQIWQQIDLQSQPLISAVCRQVNKFEKDPHELNFFFKNSESKQEKNSELVLEENDVDEDDDDDDVDDEDDLEEEDDDEDEIEDEERENKGGVEDKFLNIEEMKEFMEDDEARQYGYDEKKKTVKKIAKKYEEDDDDDDEDDELGVFGLAGDEDTSDGEDARYEDFFTSKKKVEQNKKPKVSKEVKEDIEMSDEEEEEENEDSDDKGDDDDDDMVSDEETKTANLSTHEKHLLDQRTKIEEVERENLEAKSWTMQGEVNASKRPKNSALEVDLEWERNAKPPPVITEEVSQSIEELIMKRIADGQFDDVQKAPSLPTKAPREMKELDENQSKKGLGELYANEYAQKTGLVSQALTFSDEQKKEVIEEISIQTNVPALAMEEIAPLAVSDAAMLAPEEVFSGKGDIKEETELTQEDRKRRRANKKRKFKAENAKKMAKKPRESIQTAGDGREEP